MLTLHDREIKINFKRLKKDLQELTEIGRLPEGQGLARMAFSAADMQARHWLQDKLQTAGIASDLDSAVNVCARLESQTNADQPAIMTGSHLDSVPAGGHLDGALGVLAGLECLRVIKENNINTRYPVELIAFSDEEGRFGGMFGSRALAGQLTPESIQQAVDLDGITLSEALATHGLEAMDALAARRSPASLKAFVELHIEQGPVLDSAGERIGVVEAIIGLFKWNVRLIGEANHAGTTPMHLRKDALQGLAEFAGEIPRILEEHGGEHSVATIGRVSLSPGSANSVPGTAEFSLDVRDTSRTGLNELADAIRRTLSALARRRDLMFEFDVLSEITPVDCSKQIVDTIEKISNHYQLNNRRMPSGAAHDAQTVAHIAPVGMIMIPSVGGRSHSAAEWSHWEDIEAGCNVLLQTLIELAEPVE